MSGKLPADATLTTSRQYTVSAQVLNADNGYTTTDSVTITISPPTIE